VTDTVVVADTVVDIAVDIAAVAGIAVDIVVVGISVVVGIVADFAVVDMYEVVVDTAFVDEALAASFFGALYFEKQRKQFCLLCNNPYITGENPAKRSTNPCH